MNDADTVKKINALLGRLDSEPVSMFTLKSVRDQAALLFDNRMPLTGYKTQVNDVPLPKVFKDDGTAKLKRARLEIARILNNAAYSIRLGMPSELPGEAEASFPSSESRVELVKMIDDLSEEVEASDLSVREKEQLGYLLAQARSIVADGTDANVARRELEGLLGQAVAKASQPGRASGFWKHAAEVVLFVTATLNLGTAVIGTGHANPAHIQVTCNMAQPALPAGPSAISAGPDPLSANSGSTERTP